MKQEHHNEYNECRNDGEEQPNHFFYGFLVGYGDDGFACCRVATRNESGNTQQDSYQRTRDGGTKFLGHGAAGEYQTGG